MEIPGETHLDVQYGDVSNTINNAKEELSCEREGNKNLSELKIQFCSYCSCKTCFKLPEQLRWLKITCLEVRY